MIFIPVNCSFRTRKFFKPVLYYLELVNFITGTLSFVSVIANDVARAATLDKTNLLEQVRIRLISQLINGISRVFQKLLKYFNDTIVSTSFVPSSPVLPVIFSLNLNEALLLLSAGKSTLLSLAKTGSSQ